MRLAFRLALAAILTGAAAEAQQPAPLTLPVRVRLLAAGSEGTREWTGRLEGVTPESLFVRVEPAGAVHRFARSDVRRLERSRPVSLPKAAAVGCLAVGGLFGFLGLGTSDDSGSFLGARAAVAAGVVLGCGIGALVGMLVGAGQGAWEPFDLPMREPAQAAPPAEPL